MDDCFYPTCKHAGAWEVRTAGENSVLLWRACVEHIGHAIAQEQLSSEKVGEFLVRKINL